MTAPVDRPSRDGAGDAESLLDARDQLLGIQAQLDEVHDRLDAIERRLDAGGGGRWRRVAGRVRPRRRST